MDEIRKILIHLPDDKLQTLQKVPFLNAVRSYYPDAQLNLFMNKDNFDLLSPFSLRENHFYIEQNDYQHFLNIHKYAFNTKDVFNIDLSFLLRPEWKSPFLAYCFRSRHRVGIHSLRGKLFLTQAKKYNSPMEREVAGIDLLSSFVKEPIKTSRLNLQEFTIDDESFGEVPLVNITLKKEEFENPLIVDQLKSLFELTAGVKYKFYCEDKKTDENSLKELSSENFYEFNYDQEVSIEDQCKRISYVNGVITTSPALAYYCEYYETPFYYIGDPLPSFVKFTSGIILGRDKKGVFNFNLIADQMNKHFKY